MLLLPWLLLLLLLLLLQSHGKSSCQYVHMLRSNLLYVMMQRMTLQ